MYLAIARRVLLALAAEAGPVPTAFALALFVGAVLVVAKAAL
jgi:hypothetical protein